MAQSTRPRLFWVELELDRGITYLVLDDPGQHRAIQNTLSRRQRGARTGVESPHVDLGSARNQ